MSSVHEYPRRGPRSNLVANQEVRRAMHGTYTPAFGIRRMLEGDSLDEVTLTMRDIQEQNVVPDFVDLRDDLSVTLLSQKVVARQLGRGLMARYNLGETGQLIQESQDCRDREVSLTVGRGDIQVHNGQILYATIESPALDDEITGIRDALLAAGIHGKAKFEDIPVPHLVFGETTDGRFLSAFDQEIAIDALEVQIPYFVEVAPWDVYPDNPFPI